MCVCVCVCVYMCVCVYISGRKPNPLQPIKHTTPYTPRRRVYHSTLCAFLIGLTKLAQLVWLCVV